MDEIRDEITKEIGKFNQGLETKLQRISEEQSNFKEKFLPTLQQEFSSNFIKQEQLNEL